MIIARSLYGINISASAWGEKLEETLKSLGYKSSKADTDI